MMNIHKINDALMLIATKLLCVYTMHTHKYMYSVHAWMLTEQHRNGGKNVQIIIIPINTVTL